MKKIKPFKSSFIRYATLLLLTLNTPSLIADIRPDASGPISVIGEQSYRKGDLLFSYQFSSMTMDDLGKANHRLPTSDTLAGSNKKANYMVIPTEMKVDTHQFAFMYAPSDALTWMASLPFIKKNTNYLISPLHPIDPDETFKTTASGVGDLKLFNLVNLKRVKTGQLILGLGLSFPTGATDEADHILALPKREKTQLPYSMQLGSGTYDALTSLTYKQVLTSRSWGAKGSTVTRFGNNNGYSLGNRASIQVWHAWPLNDELGLSLRLGAEQWDNIDGFDERNKIPVTLKTGGKNYQTMPGLDPHQYGGTQLDLACGLNGVYGSGKHRLALEISSPVKQDLEGPQMQRDLVLEFGYQKAF